MNTTAATAHAEQLAAHLTNTRDCDALEPCQSCRVKAAEVRIIRRAALVAAATPAVTLVPAPRRALFARLDTLQS